MAITTYGELKDTLTAYMFHQRLAAQYDNSTIAFERAANRRLRVREMEASVSLTTVNGIADLPDDYLQWRTVLNTGTTPYKELEWVHPAYMKVPYTTGGYYDPPVFTTQADIVRIRPVDDTADLYQFHYYQKIPTIVGSTDNDNWLLLAHPDAYLYGVLTELMALQRNREAAELYKARRDETFAEITRLSSFTTGATSAQVREGDYF